MPHALPNDSQCAGDHQVPENGVEDQRPLGEVIAVDVDAGKAAGHPAACHPDHPVPLPAAADGVEPLLRGQEELAVLAQIYHCEDKAKSEEDAEGDARDRALPDVL